MGSQFLTAWLPALAPAALIAVAIVAETVPAGRRAVPRVRRLATWASWIVMVVAIAAAALLILDGPMTSTLLGAHGFGLSIRLDALSETLFLLIGFLGVIVVRFSGTYLSGDARHGVFLGRLCLTFACVALLVLSGNLVQLVLAWIATSMALHRLLVFYPERNGARNAARKKFLTARLGDACLIAAALLLARAAGTADIATILDQARAAGSAAMPMSGLAAMLLAGAALLKSAQFPTHGWLIEVMETPTPVSALLHAGIINAGGFLVLRFAAVVAGAPGAMHLLAAIGALTALIGAMVAPTQTSVKVGLAWSTVGQMGFMMFECGIGAFAVALLHVVAHALYKAHAFLTSGSAADGLRQAPGNGRAMPAAPGTGGFLAVAVLASLALAAALYGGIAALLPLGDDDLPHRVLGLILVLGTALAILRTLDGAPDWFAAIRILPSVAAMSLAYIVVQAGAAALFAGSLAATPVPDAASVAIIGLAAACFAAVAALQALGGALQRQGWWRALHVHLANGLYANAAFDRLAGGLRHPAPALSMTETPQ